MQKFLALYTGTAGSFDRAGWNAMDAEARRQREAAAMQAWADWGAKYAHAIVDVGGPLGRPARGGPAGRPGGAHRHDPGPNGDTERAALRARESVGQPRGASALLEISGSVG